MSPGLIRAAAGHVFGGWHHADHADWCVQQRNRAHRAGDRRPAGHVVLHPLHAVGRFDRNAAGVEGDALADQAEDRRLWCTGRLVTKHHQSRRLAAAARDAKQQTHAQLGNLLFVENLHATPASAASLVARIANSRGVSVLPGSFASSRARLLHSPSTRPRSTARCSAADSTEASIAIVHCGAAAGAGSLVL
jgi:hypothetical protein